MQRCDILVMKVNVAQIFPIGVRFNILQCLDKKMVAPSETILFTVNEGAAGAFDNGASRNIAFVNLVQREFWEFAHVKSNIRGAWVRRDIDECDRLRLRSDDSCHGD